MEKQNQQPVRLQSLDALRGFDMLFIMGGGALLVALATMFPIPFFQAIAEQTSHVEWNGCHMEDMIFPTSYCSDKAARLAKATFVISETSVIRFLYSQSAICLAV